MLLTARPEWPPGGPETTGGPFVGMHPTGGGVIFMPLPGNIVWNDTHGFSTVDESKSIIGKAGGIASIAKGAVTRNSETGERLNLLNAAAGLAAGGAFGAGAVTVGSGSGLGAGGAIINPQTRTLFTGSNIRTFSFEFKLVPKTKEETESVQAIHSEIRKWSYPKAIPGTNNVILEFPSVWDIRLYNIKNAPRIMPCYLTSFTTTFNPSTLIWREDNNPVEISLSIAFTETRPPTRDDLVGRTAAPGAPNEI